MSLYKWLDINVRQEIEKLRRQRDNKRKLVSKWRRRATITENANETYKRQIIHLRQHIRDIEQHLNDIAH